VGDVVHVMLGNGGCGNEAPGEVAVNQRFKRRRTKGGIVGTE